jgi:hypothetical protein
VVAVAEVVAAPPVHAEPEAVAMSYARTRGTPASGLGDLVSDLEAAAGSAASTFLSTASGQTATKSAAASTIGTWISNNPVLAIGIGIGALVGVGVLVAKV